MNSPSYNIRLIRSEDNEPVATLIRRSLELYDLALPGTSYFDSSLDYLYDHYQNQERSVYFVMEVEDKIVGCGGVGPIPGLTETAELQKLYLESNYIHKGLGRVLFQTIRAQALELGYSQLYLESSDKLVDALKFYERQGFKPLNGPLEAMSQGHFTMNQWMVLDL